MAGGGGPDKEIGIWLALAGAGLMVAGAVLATTRISLAVEARRRDAEPEEPTAPLTRTEPRGEASRRPRPARPSGSSRAASWTPGGSDQP